MFAALNRFWKPMTMDQYLDELDIPMTNNAVNVMCKSPDYSREVQDWIWEKERAPFEMYD